VRIKFWGVRGSIPTPLSTEQLNDRLFQAVAGARGVNVDNPADVQAYLGRLPPSVRGVVGGNTTCVEVDTGGDPIIIDAGSGLRGLGLSLMAREFGRGQGTAHLFFTHAHWDHLQGYPFFTPAYVPGNRVIHYAVGHDPHTFLEHQQVAPMYFPIPPSAMLAEKEYVTLREGQAVTLGRTTITSLALYHPGTAYAYRVDDGESVFVFASDAEYKSLGETGLRRYINFFRGADALVFDAQYSLRDVFLSKADWGHSSATIGVDIAERAQVKNLVLFHHDPTHTDEQIYAIAQAASDYAVLNGVSPNTRVLVGTEGLELFLGQVPGLELLESAEGADGVRTLALAGQLSAATAAEAHRRLAAALADSAEAAPPGRVLLDLTLLAAADALGVKALLDAARALPTAHLAVLAPTLPIRRVLDQCGAGDEVALAHTRAQALAALAGSTHLHLANQTLDGQFALAEVRFADDWGVVYAGRDLAAGDSALVRLMNRRSQPPAAPQAPLWPLPRTASLAQALYPPPAQQAPYSAHPYSASYPAAISYPAQVTRLRAWHKARHPSLLAARKLIEGPDWLALAWPAPAGSVEPYQLRQWLAGHPAWLDRWLLAGQLAQALAGLHGAGLVHGQLQPECVVAPGWPLGQAEAPSRALLVPLPLFARPGSQPPTAYLAPEQLRGAPPSTRADVYALGILLYEVLLGAQPFAAESDELRFTLQLYSQPQSPRLCWPEIPPDLERFMLALLAADPAERPVDGAAVLAAFDGLSHAALAGGPPAPG
jgi:phosphoribosyl 1,2-cyclic phosphodiesterase